MTNPDSDRAEPPDRADPAAVAFARYLAPPLRSGPATVTVTQEVAAGSEIQTYSTARTLHVTGRRYTLAPGDIDSVFPPSGTQGEFTGTLAHVVLTRPTLPWQRTPGGDAVLARDAAVSGTDTGPIAPWLAVLLFEQLDPVPQPTPTTLADLRPAGTTFFPPRTAEPGEQDSDPVTVIDVPADLFQATAPSLTDLAWLGHARQVTNSAKPAAPGGASPGPDYAVVVGNRLPASGAVCTAHLVSLEGYGPHLPAADGSPGTLPPGTTAVRLVTLYSWRFTAVDLKETFQETLLAVNLDPPVLALPAAPGPDPDDPADLAVRHAFGLGYTAMDHTLREGASVSWYRGPLLPLGTPSTSASGNRDADQLLRYDPTTGMFDASYAAAWQLGRLLALNDGAFAPALYRWKLAHGSAAAAALEAGIIDQALPPAAAQSTATEDPATRATPGNERHRRLLRAVSEVAGPAAAALAAYRESEG